jgi:hypothetical protein
MGAAIQGKFTIRIMARGDLWQFTIRIRARRDLRQVTSGSGQEEIFGKTPSKTVNPDRVSYDTDQEEKVPDLIISDTKKPDSGSYPQSSTGIKS